MSTRTLSRRSRRTEEPEEEYAEDRRHDDEEPPRRGRARGRSRSTEDEEDEAPRARRSSRRDPDEEDERPRRSRRSEDREDRPRPSTGRGWKAFQQKREERSDYVKNFTLPEKKAVIKILDEEPFSVYAEHWIDELPKKKSFVCIGDDCPLCAIGEKARVYAMFNILDLTDPEDPKVRPWKVSQTTSDVLQEYAMDSKTAPLNREDLYWSIYKSGGGAKGRVQVNLAPIKARDLEEDWDIPPFSDDELDEFTLYGEDDVLYFNTRKELKEIADSLD